MIAAPMSTSLLEFMYLRYGSPISRFCADVVRISSGVLASRIHAAGLSAATAENRGPQLADPHEVLLGVPAGGGADRRLEHRVDLHRQVHAALGLRRVRHVEVLAEHHRRLVLGRRRPREHGVLLAGPHPGPPRLPAGEHDDVELAGEDLP